MPSLTCFNRRFTPSWLSCILFCLFFSAFIRLGFWQLERAHEKKAMLKAASSYAQKSPLNWESSQKTPHQYQKIKLQGRFLPELFLLDNQHYQHQFGYNVLSPLLLANQQVILIDRGFVPARQRQDLVDIETSKTLVDLKGTVYFPSPNRWILGNSIEKKNHQLTIIETINPQMIAQILQKKVYPFIMRLDKEDPHGFIREWAIVSMPYQRHLAYAVQWFAMAGVILILFLALNLKSHYDY